MLSNFESIIWGYVAESKHKYLNNIMNDKPHKMSSYNLILFQLLASGLSLSHSISFYLFPNAYSIHIDQIFEKLLSKNLSQIQLAVESKHKTLAVSL